MGQWLPSVKIPPIEFDGDLITFTVKPLETKAMVVLSKYIDREKGIITFSNAMEICDVSAQILPDYVEVVDGMKIGNGDLVTKEMFVTLTGQFYFAPLLGTLLTKIIEVSSVRQVEAKN